MMADADLRELSIDIKAHGLRDAITTLDGKILDGRNRHRACELAGVVPTFEEFIGDDPLGFVISHNLHRRHLTESQRAMVGAKWAKLKRGGESGIHKTNPPIGGLVSETKTRDEAASLLNVGVSSIDRAKKVIKNAIPEVKEMVEKGELTVNAAWGVSKLSEEEQKQAAEQGKQALLEASKRSKDATKRTEPDPEPVVVDGTKPTMQRTPKWKPDDAERLWLLAKTDLDKILPSDVSRQRIMEEVIKYASNRIEKNI